MGEVKSPAEQEAGIASKNEGPGSRAEEELRRRASTVQDEDGEEDDEEEEEEDDDSPAPLEGSVPLQDLAHGQPRSQSGIATRSFLLGQALGISLLLAFISLVILDSRIWRAPFFLSCLALFHFLEFWTHAKYNIPKATTSAFLFSDNGAQYQIAHGSAMLETIVMSVVFPGWQASVSKPWMQGIGLISIVVGQYVRSMAIATAGTNFNHKVQSQRAVGHILVTNGVYSYLRHPSYFGFFWWALGTQLLIGNTVCFLGYALVLWKFFSTRIRVEEIFLTRFFGKAYTQYRARTRVGIPFIP